ncbi:hypothetical protein [Spartinivicinus poritis]|uniref:Uncharacterized protein n=1 Tax=Spartinivicinus poritis TaxID=2994640 RepID=A0ABT5U8B2_9GAMM|nr:hypothetical protein [Spartinivicinus sp. A2-2]MDE1462605.1 hypothetical protein [Spartinivicinus sp. A2-2]
MKSLIQATLTSGLICLAFLANAQELTVGQHAQASQQSAQPGHGMKQQEVVAKYGQPSEKTSVGQPIISTWRYADFTVYFENDTVLHSVANRSSQE